MSRRCPGCGAFFTGDTCPNPHAEQFEALPPLAATHTGRIVSYDWKGTPMIFVVLSEPDEAGRVGLAALQENVRAHLDDLEEV